MAESTQETEIQIQNASINTMRVKKLLKLCENSKCLINTCVHTSIERQARLIFAQSTEPLIIARKRLSMTGYFI